MAAGQGQTDMVSALLIAKAEIDAHDEVDDCCLDCMHFDTLTNVGWRYTMSVGLGE